MVSAVRLSIARLILPLLAAGAQSASIPTNPANPFAAAMAENIYQTPNYYIGAYHYIQCWGNDLVVPKNTKQVAEAVNYYYQKTKAGQPVTMRTSRPRFHSSARFVCPNSPLKAGGKLPKGIKPPISVGIMQHKLNKVLAVDCQKYTMRVGAGMTYTELLKEATAASMSVQIGTPTAYGGLTLAGVLATSGHGSGDKTISGLWDTLLEITWVDGTGKIHMSKPGDPEFQGMVGGLGVYGIMTELLMKMTPPRSAELITVRKNDTNMFKAINELLKITPHILVAWRPDAREFTAYLLKYAPAGAKEAKNVSMTILPNVRDEQKIADVITLWMRHVNDDSEAFNLICPFQFDTVLESPWATVNGTGVKNVTGPINDLLASECDDHCNWNDKEVLFATAQDVEFTAEFDQLEDWITDVKKVFDVELRENGKAEYRCMGLGYMWIRFGSGFDGYTATNAGLKRPVYLQSTWIRSRAVPMSTIRYQFAPDLIEQLTLCKYNGRPHWGKNFDRTFALPKCGIRDKYPKFDNLLKLQAAHDPAKMFEPRLFRRVVNNEGFALSPRCALWQHCYCEADIHCPVGSKCVRAKTFPEYKVCKYPIKDEPGKLLAPLMKVLTGA